MNIKAKLLGYSLLSIAFCLSISAIGLWAAAYLGNEMDRNLTAMSGLRSSMDANMMHDALRADVLASIVAAGKNFKLATRDTPAIARHARAA